MLGNEDATQTLLEWKIVGSKEEALKLNLTLRSPSASLSVVQLPLPELLSNYTVVPQIGSSAVSKAPNAIIFLNACPETQCNTFQLNASFDYRDKEEI